MSDDLSPTDLDILMSKDPTELSKQDIDSIISYHRKQRARRASGEKTVKDTAGPKVDVMALLDLKPKAPLPTITRRV